MEDSLISLHAKYVGSLATLDLIVGINLIGNTLIQLPQLLQIHFNQPSTPRPSVNPIVNNVLRKPIDVFDPKWCLDSSGTRHMTPNVMNLMEKADYDGSQKVMVGSGSTLSVHHVESSKFQPSFSSKSLHLNNLLHVPHIDSCCQKFVKCVTIYS